MKRDESKLPQWVQEELRHLRNALEAERRTTGRLSAENEKLSGLRQEALDALWQAAREGNATAIQARERHQEGKSLRPDTEGDY